MVNIICIKVYTGIYRENNVVCCSISAYIFTKCVRYYHWIGEKKKIVASHHCLQQQPTTGYKPNASNGPKCVYRPNKDKQTIRTEEEKRTWRWNAGTSS